MGPNKYVHLFFAAGGLLLAFLLAKSIDWVWGYFAKPDEMIVNGAALVIGVVTVAALYKRQSVFASAQEVTVELEKVTWPSRKETSAATVVVIVTVAIASVILSVFDAIWSYLSGRILS